MCEGIEGYNCSILNPFEHYHHFFWRAQSLGDTETSYTSEETQNLIETPLWKMYMLIERVSISTLKTKERILGSFHLTECHAGLLCCPSCRFCIFPFLIHSKQKYYVYIVYCNILQIYYHKSHCIVYYNIPGKCVRSSAHQIHKVSYFLGKWGAGRGKEGDTLRRCLSPACDVYFTR